MTLFSDEIAACLVIAVLVLFCYAISEHQEKKKLLAEREKYYNTVLQRLQGPVKEVVQMYPWTAQQYADLMAASEEQLAWQLAYKKHPARSAAEQVKAVSTEKKILRAQCKQLEYQLNFLKVTFPWLEDYMEVDPKEAYRLARQSESETPEEESYERYRAWLSPQEYSSLPTAQKYQLALERYLQQPRSDWEAGILYERYVGYMYEKDGWKVQYIGATQKLEDMGRDLLAEKDGIVHVIQCKRWRTDKLIRENVVFQTYGTAILYKIQNKNKEVHSAIVTTARLSETAKNCAEYLGVIVTENYPLGSYPLIKCNIGKGGERIYHLPFDQQYDRVRITGKDNACYVSTVEEAENLGFRRAKRWYPERS